MDPRIQENPGNQKFLLRCTSSCYSASVYQISSESNEPFQSSGAHKKMLTEGQKDRRTEGQKDTTIAIALGHIMARRAKNVIYLVGLT